ncbi:MAG: glucosamine inositolphosphorylceramide transferase family protein [Devosia sp.]
MGIGLVDPAPISGKLDRILKFEGSRAATSLAHRDAAPAEAGVGRPDLVVDFTGRAGPQIAPVLTLTFSDSPDLEAGLGALLADDLCTRLIAHLDAAPVAQARPMLNDRVWLGRVASGLLAGAISLIESCVARFAAGTLAPIAATFRPSASGDLARVYPLHIAKGLGRRAWRKLTRRRPFYWRTAYRFIDGPGIADTGTIEGDGFVELPDDGSRFYADPFAFEWQGRPYLFVEDFPFAEGRGLISVAELGPDGRFGVPQPIITEPHHLSYPQVFSHDGEVYLIPEGSAANELVLYRATDFPHGWVRDTVLVPDRALNDMTLIVRDGRFWLIGTEQIGSGSSSDTMVALSAPTLRGPWTSHGMNPLRIDHSATRPGGAFIERDGRVLLPLQDGSSTYGGGLGLAELASLTDKSIQFEPVVPVKPGPAWPDRAIHTLTRAGRLEAIDSAIPR